MKNCDFCAGYWHNVKKIKWHLFINDDFRGSISRWIVPFIHFAFHCNVSVTAYECRNH